MTTPLLQILPQQPTHDKPSGATQFEIELSVSKKEVRSKAEGGPVTAFEVLRLNSQQEDALKIIFTAKNYSTNVWSGNRHSSTYKGMTGVALDFDGGMSIDEAKAAFAPYNYILHTSTSHMVDKDGMIAERFRVILPFAPGELRFRSPAECDKVYLKLLSQYPTMDPACTDAARQFFPFSREKGAAFHLQINATGKYFDVDISDVPDDVIGPKYEERAWDGVLRPKAELDRILKFCPFVKWMDQHIDNPKTEMHEPLRFGLMSNLSWYEGGREEIHRILSRDCRAGKYYPGLVDEKIDRIVEAYNPYTYARLIKLGWPGPAPQKPAAPAGWGKIGTKKARDFVQLDWDDRLIVQLVGVWTVTSLDELRADLLPELKKLPAICPVCGDDAAVAKLDTFHFANIWCEKCQKAYYEAPVSPGMFTYKGKILRVERRAGRFISMETLQEESFRTDLDYKYAKRKLLSDPDRLFLDDGFQIRRIGNADFEKLDYEFRMQENALIFRFPALPVKIQDNAFIDAFLDPMFGAHADFIKDWLAMYCYTNYLVLPVVVLTSERSCGKGTFANMVTAIFPTLAGQWDGVKESFNDQYKNKLLFVDENPNAEKPMQYTEIKKITGNKVLRINEKYVPAYYVPNNINIIISTNDPRPMFLKAREEPKSENVNNFFIYRVPDVDTKLINEELGAMLEERLGYYVRTELRTRYLRLMTTRGTNNRYGLPTPITPLARELFSSSKSTVEMEAEELARHLVFGIDNMADPFDNGWGTKINFEATIHDGKRYVQLAKIRELVAKLRFKGSSNPKAYISVLQDMNVLSHDASARTKDQHLGYRILRDKSHYDKLPGLLPDPPKTGDKSDKSSSSSDEETSPF